MCVWGGSSWTVPMFIMGPSRALLCWSESVIYFCCGHCIENSSIFLAHSADLLSTKEISCANGVRLSCDPWFSGRLAELPEPQFLHL